MVPKQDEQEKSFRTRALSFSVALGKSASASLYFSISIMKIWEPPSYSSVRIHEIKQAKAWRPRAARLRGKLGASYVGKLSCLRPLVFLSLYFSLHPRSRRIPTSLDSSYFRVRGAGTDTPTPCPQPAISLIAKEGARPQFLPQTRMEAQTSERRITKQPYKVVLRLEWAN